MANRHSWIINRILYGAICIGMMLTCGCQHLDGSMLAKSAFEEANSLYGQGDYQASLAKYAQIMAAYPATGDRVLFEMGIIHSHPKNELRDDQKALASFQQLIKQYPDSAYRKDSETMSFNLNTVAVRDKTIAAQQVLIATLQSRIEAIQQEVRGKELEISSLQKQIEAQEKKYFAFVLEKGSADRVLIEKADRRLTLYAKGEVLKVYRIALGGNPVGAKERQGDNKTPEGKYHIEGRNRDSRFHLSLRISYPNERDRKRARELGVAPGSDIMIHGLKNGYSWVGDMHTVNDWTQGCVAVTDEEIEEIAKLVPNGTPVEIRP